MLTPDCANLIELAPGELLSLDDARGTTVTVTRGRAWVTQHRDPRDIVLEAGDSWAIERPGLTVVEAHGATVVRLAGPAARSVAPRVPHVAMLDRFGAWLESLAMTSARREHRYL